MGSCKCMFLQVHFDISPHCQNVDPESFVALKVSNALRYEVLTEILTSLGLNCEPDQTPAPSPVHLLATSQVRPTALKCPACLSSLRREQALGRMKHVLVQILVIPPPPSPLQVQTVHPSCRFSAHMETIRLGKCMQKYEQVCNSCKHAPAPRSLIRL